MKSHEFDPISFISGVAITLIGLVFLLPADTGDLIAAVSEVGSWAWPAILIGLGVAVIAPALLRQSSDQDGAAVDERDERPSL